jgi:NAD(P)-dependent dehydrogenase (short-subunit alcohol dehydrogenase family)
LKAALEARQYGIRVNALSPGFILTKIAEPIVKSDPQVFEAWKSFEARQGRTGKPEEIGDAVALLSSNQMSLVNGQNLIVDG